MVPLRFIGFCGFSRLPGKCAHPARNAEAVKLLLAARADVNDTDARGATALPLEQMGSGLRLCFLGLGSRVKMENQAVKKMDHDMEPAVM